MYLQNEQFAIKVTRCCFTIKLSVSLRRNQFPSRWEFSPLGKEREREKGGFEMETFNPCNAGYQREISLFFSAVVGEEEEEEECFLLSL